MTAALTPLQQDGLKQVVDLMEVHNLAPSEVKKSWAERKKKNKLDDSGNETSKSEIILRLFAYLGGTLICAGLGVFIETIWDDIGSASRVIITFGSGFTAYLCGLFFLADKRLEKAATPAHILAFFLQPFGLFVFLQEYYGEGDPALGGLFVFGALALQQGLTFIKYRRPSFLFFTLAYILGFAGALTEYFDIDRGFSSLVWGLFFFFITVDLQKRENFKDLTPLLYIISVTMLFAGLYYYIGRTIYDPIGLSVALAMLLFSYRNESKTLYVLSMFNVCGYFCGGPGGGWELWGFYKEFACIFTGASLLLTGHWLKRVSYISLYPLWMFIGVEYIFGGFYSMVYETPFEVLFVGICALGIYASLLLRSRAVLAASVLSLIGFIVSFTAQHFGHTVGWPLLLIVIGFATLASGFLFARLSGRIKATAPG